jgi:hypothetical protein
MVEAVSIKSHAGFDQLFLSIANSLSFATGIYRQVSLQSPNDKSGPARLVTIFCIGGWRRAQADTKGSYRLSIPYALRRMRNGQKNDSFLVGVNATEILGRPPIVLACLA